MALTVTKVKAKTKPAVEVAAQVPLTDTPLDKLTLEELADRYGSAHDAVSALKMRPEYAQFDEVSKELKRRLPDLLEPQDTGELKGDHFLLEIGAASKVPASVADLNLLRKLLGEKTFMEIASVNVGDVRKYCTPEQVAKVLKEDNGYTQTRKIVAKFLG